jgi:SAM-dependent methyltransferase
MIDLATLEGLSESPGIRTDHYHQLLQKFYDVATCAYMHHWGPCFHLPPFTPGQTLEQACTVQEHQIARHFHPGQHILDLGCGIGGPARSIASAIATLHITGINIVQKQIDIANQLTEQVNLSSQITFTNADFTRLPFPDESFDGAYTFDALCHSPDKQTTYQEIHRVLKPGATFTGTDWMHTNNLTPDKYTRWIEPVCHYSALPNVLCPHSIAELLTQAGFTVHSSIDLADETDLTPNWDLFDDAAISIATESDPAHHFMYYHCTTTAAAARAGAFTIGAWTATA